MTNFNPRAPCGARLLISVIRSRTVRISPHAPLAGRDDNRGAQAHSGHYFNPRAPCGARPAAVIMPYVISNFNPRAPCGARRFTARAQPDFQDFNPRAPCGARPVGCFPAGRSPDRFQPTRPLRGATDFTGWAVYLKLHFNPRAPCGARPGARRFKTRSLHISTHAPLAGRDRVGLLCGRYVT